MSGEGINAQHALCINVTYAFNSIRLYCQADILLYCVLFNIAFCVRFTVSIYLQLVFYLNIRNILCATLLLKLFVLRTTDTVF